MAKHRLAKGHCSARGLKVRRRNGYAPYVASDGSVREFPLGAGRRRKKHGKRKAHKTARQIAAAKRNIKKAQKANRRRGRGRGRGRR